MNNKFKALNWVGGAGGNWLFNLIYLLENNSRDIALHPRVNYHTAPPSKNLFKFIKNSYHIPIFDGGYFYNGRCKFNFYINCMVKYNIHDLRIDKVNLIDRLDNFSGAAYYTIGYPDNVDLDYEWIYTDPDKFIDTLFLLLDTIGFTYYKNRDVCHAKIKEFKKTCINPKDHIDNWNSDIWLGWCLGLLRHKEKDLPFDFFKVEQREFLVDYLKNCDMEFEKISNNLILLWD